MASERILELLRRPSTPTSTRRSASSGRPTRSPRTTAIFAGLLSTLTEDCVYTVAGTGARWEGHEGAAGFYTELLTAFPDIHFELDYIVIGPQGVCEEAIVTATHQGRWLDARADRREADLAERDLLPVGSGARLFKGEMVYTDLRFPTV